MEVSLLQMLQAREERCQRQQQLLRAFEKPLICFTMNIAGPIKCSPLIAKGFSLGLEELRQRLALKGIPILHLESQIQDTGCQAFLVADAPAQALKAITAGLEDTAPAGRLYDMDVLDQEGKKLDRQLLGLPMRKCLICHQSAAICGRSRAHSIPQLQQATQSLLFQAIAQRIAALAVQGLLCEVYTTPKPGLVDLRNTGSHRDMDLFTFLRSAAALWPYFRRCAQLGLEAGPCPSDLLFPALRREGLAAEQTMLRATGGINTHKGAIFVMGLLCAAAGALACRPYDPEALCQFCANTVGDLVALDLQAVTQDNAATTGQRLYAQLGITGARGQAQAGFPAICRVGLPALKAGLSLGHSLNRAGCGALLAILAHTDDTNLIARSDPQTAARVRAAVARQISRDPYPETAALEALDDDFIRKNLSPGGSADLLAASYFLLFLGQAPA